PGNAAQEGLRADVSSLVNAGLQYALFDGVVFSGFAGDCIHLKGRPNDAASANQWNVFRNVHCQPSPRSKGYVLEMDGYAGQNQFEDCDFSGNGADTKADIYLGSPGTYGPLSNHFHNTTIQGRGNIGVLFNGASNIDFNGTHFEDVPRAFKLTHNATQGAASNA